MRIVLLAFLLTACGPMIDTHCSDLNPPDMEQHDYYPAAEQYVWHQFLRQTNDPPPTIYVDQLCRNGMPGIDNDGACEPGVINVYYWAVYINRTPGLLPSQSFLCEGYLFAQLVVGPRDYDFELSRLDLGDVLRWGPYLDLCNSELAAMEK